MQARLSEGLQAASATVGFTAVGLVLGFTQRPHVEEGGTMASQE